MTRVADCLFCRIVAGDLPAARILETDRAVVILDINPVVKGHLLIIPRSHHPHLGDLPAELAAHAGSLLPQLTRALMSGLSAQGSNTIINSGEVAGQTIGHCHWHVIPRYRDDDVQWPWPHASYSDGEISRTASRIIQELSADPSS